MFEEREFTYPQLLLGGLSVFVILAIIVAASTSSAAFGFYNPSWEGTSELQQQADAVGADSRVVLNTTTYTDVEPSETVAIILSPEQRYSATETRRIRQFVRDGGTLVVADDFGTQANVFLRNLGVSTRITGSLLRDEQRNYRSPALPIATNVTNASLTEDVDQVTLNHGSVLEAGNATVLVRSSEFSYLDRNRNGELDPNETVASRPVVTSESVGEGRVIVASDASIFINAMVDRPGNQQFVRNLFDSAQHVLLDYSHRSSQPPLALATLYLQRIPLLQALLGALGLGVIAVWQRRSTGSNGLDEVTTAESAQQTGHREEALVSYLKERHPDWEESHLRRVMAGIISQTDEREDNE